MKIKINKIQLLQIVKNVIKQVWYRPSYFKQGDKVYNKQYGQGMIAWDNQDGTYEVVFRNHGNIVPAGETKNKIIYYDGSGQSFNKPKKGFYRFLGNPKPFSVQRSHPSPDQSRYAFISKGDVKIMDQDGKIHLIKDYTFSKQYLGTTRIRQQYLNK